MEMQQMLERLFALQEQIIAEMKADREMMAAETKDMRNKRMEAHMSDGQKETTACQDAMEANLEKTESNPGIMQYIEEHQEIPKEEAAVKPVGGPRKRRRVRNLTA
jgi:uncharacterized protein YdaU (DUF1376 family)